jgi:hypothetical protein
LIELSFGDIPYEVVDKWVWTEIFYEPVCKKKFIQPTYKIDMCLFICEKHIFFNRMCFLVLTYFFSSINKKNMWENHMFKWHISILYVSYIKFLAIWFVKNFCSMGMFFTLLIKKFNLSNWVSACVDINKKKKKCLAKIGKTTVVIKCWE